ncbi:MAG: hypothetical protein H6737_15920 [Alphaproteobacteria bacterium]|nr:hypothetical protein [Alphaproteobacteria bacterium]
MDWDRTEEGGTDTGLLGWLSVAFGVAGIVSHMLCCVIGGLSLLITVVLTGLGLVTGYVGYKQAATGKDQHALSIVGLSLALANFVILTALALVQCYFVGLIGLVLLSEH